MARSQIIKDFTNSSFRIEVALKKLRVLLEDIGDESTINWVKNELTGYEFQGENIPSYRVFRGSFQANYVVGNRYGYREYTKSSLPLSHLDKEIINDLLEVRLDQSISTLEHIVQNNESLSMSVPNEYYPLIQKGSNAKILHAHVAIDFTQIKDILSTVDNKVLEILLMLEREFGNLDDLTLDISLKEQEDLKQIIKNIQVIIYDQSIKIGDNNKIKHTKLETNN